MVLPNANLLRDLRLLLPRPWIHHSQLSSLVISRPRCRLHTSLPSSSSSPASLRTFKHPEKTPRRDQQKTRSAQPAAASGAPSNHLSAEELKCLQMELGDPEYWQLIYRLKAMPFVQVKQLIGLQLVENRPLNSGKLSTIVNWIRKKDFRAPHPFVDYPEISNSSRSPSSEIRNSNKKEAKYSG
ncbi:unnamed protein product [Dibothriocephalus latus]|uniref:Uncharacterized protein n=1 Tax=Dibothriocephalus latus TaxID=60516 RepID=A0A3P7RUL6_DIBLA|nr:unnamed protein product [Dibothriocephalus latus]